MESSSTPFVSVGVSCVGVELLSGLLLNIGVDCSGLLLDTGVDCTGLLLDEEAGGSIGSCCSGAWLSFGSTTSAGSETAGFSGTEDTSEDVLSELVSGSLTSTEETVDSAAEELKSETVTEEAVLRDTVSDTAEFPVSDSFSVPQPASVPAIRAEAITAAEILPYFIICTFSFLDFLTINILYYKNPKMSIY